MCVGELRNWVGPIEAKDLTVIVGCLLWKVLLHPARSIMDRLSVLVDLTGISGYDEASSIFYEADVQSRSKMTICHF